jgi:hypothetical protein
VRNLVAHISKLSHYNRNLQHGIQNRNQEHRTKHSLGDYKPTNKYPDWMIDPPANPSETKLVDRCIYTWCTKCRQGQGLWVCRHNTETHVDDYANIRNQ